MSDQNAQEPTMEEILASIRRIISEDEPVSAPSTEANSATNPHGDEHEDDILELTERVEADGSDDVVEDDEVTADTAFESSGDLDIYTRAPEPAPAPAPSFRSPERMFTRWMSWLFLSRSFMPISTSSGCLKLRLSTRWWTPPCPAASGRLQTGPAGLG